jgi:hypothetical protein
MQYTTMHNGFIGQTEGRTEDKEMFEKGQKVRYLKTGKTYTVLYQRDCQVFMVEGGYIHPAHLVAA